MSIFLSHNSADKDMVRRVGLRLQARDAKVWIDEAEIRAGDSLIQKIADGITDCEYVLAFLSKTSITSRWVERELLLAVTHEIDGHPLKVIPILLDRVRVPNFLRDKLYLDFTSEAKFQENFASLLIALDIERHFRLTLDSLELLDYHAALVTGDAIVAVGSAPSEKDDYVYGDPDGAKYPYKDLFIVRASPAGLQSRRFTHTRLGQCCIGETPHHYIVFSNSKPRPETYDMCGFKWMIRKTDLSLQGTHTVFENVNAGFYPTIDKHADIHHFCFDGYWRCLNAEKVEHALPADMEKQHIAFLAEMSAGVIPNSSLHVANVLREKLGAADG